MADRIEMTGVKGMVADIQRCSVHDGPGLRTTVFFKGCQLNCPWCHNPETIGFGPEEMRYPDKCIGCGQCESGCFSGARIICGAEMTVDDVMRQAEQDAPYYAEDGGVTLSGGEPLCQPEFALALAKACRNKGIQVGLESNLCFPPQHARPLLENIDLLMADMKLWDSAEHKRWTGLPNGYVKENLWQAAELKLPIILRTPVVPGVNDDIKQIRQIAAFAATLPTLRYYELLAYHPLGVDKARALGREARRFVIPSAEMMATLANAAAEQGIWTMVNGRTHAKPGHTS
jgi:glycyl-radical enzyme activating protein